MILAPLPLSCDDEVIVDWFELYVLTSRYGAASLGDLGRLWDTRRNSETSTFDEQTDDEIAGDDGDQIFIEKVSSAIRERMTYLGQSYPFKFSRRGNSLEFVKELTVGKRIYLFCLLLSVNCSDEIFDLNRYNYTLTNRVRDLFQACSTWAAAAYISGSAVSFGFPRPDGSDFLKALTRVYTLFGEGRVVQAPRPGVSTNPKDEGIDVIAWGHRADGASGVQYLLGQVATGKNWKDKTVLAFDKPFHENWFDEIPPSQHTTGMFIPHCIKCTNATLKQQLAIETRKFGSVFYRFVLPVLAEAGVEHARKEKKNVTVERIKDFKAINSWVTKILKEMTATGAH